jgi:hypothetical protein
VATRNLARTVIEVGRTKSSKEQRRQLRRVERRDGRRYCREAANEADLDDLRSAPLRRRNNGLAQDDKLGPARRWMDSRVGRPWSEVFSELSVKFRRRGIALSHVVDTHMLRWVDRGELLRWKPFFEYVVDDEGVLQFGPFHGKRYSWKGAPRPRVSMAEVDRWADNRKVIVRGNRCYWTSPDRWERPTWEGVRVTYESHRQGSEFSPEDYEFWAAVGDYDKGRVSLAVYALRD